MAGVVPYEDITPELRAAGIRVRPWTVDATGVADYVQKAGYASLPYYDRGAAPNAYEKYLEHYLSMRLLAPTEGDVLVDIACMDSPFSEIVAELYGLSTYRQDITYPAGIRDRMIGGDAATMPVPDGFADHLVMHCSFEHFEGDSDIRFVREASRVLRPGGRLCILPLYTSQEYAIQTHPRGLRAQRIEFERGDTVYVSDAWGPPHQRYYDTDAFLRRIVEELGDLELTIYRITNLEDLQGDCYLRFAALLRKPA